MTAATTTAISHVDAVVVDVRHVPRGRKGLWGALTASVALPDASPSLPLVDSAELGRRASMFAYDPSLATAFEG
jgi:hypothetical protein